jgi:hypothetical protein
VPALPEAERAVTRQLALDLMLDGARTVGDALAVVKSADQAARRALPDRAQRRAGLPTTAEVDAGERVEQASYSEFVKAAHDPRPLRLTYSASGAIIDANAAADDAARAEAEERSRRARREAIEQERQALAAEPAEHERAWRERLERELPPGIVG